jgi:hypothetical protein
MEGNPFNPTGRGALEPGTYKAKLEEIETKLAPPFEAGGEPRKALVFRFRTLDGSQITKIVNASNHDKSNCVQLARSLSATPLTPAQTGSPIKFWDFLQSLIGTEYHVKCEPSACGRYNNFISAMIAPQTGERAA